ncbi:ABC transporter ATP-binding protein [Candidatus Sumerlaeota bacterium]|nr:ABC transporter ATP-binding protein [Candidatus Sumerlaeota bacterium]
MTNNDTSIIANLCNVSKAYYGKTALRNIDLTLTQGQSYGLLGPNGSGKTTLMKLIAGLHRQTAGTITVMGKPITWRTKSVVAYMPTENFIYDDFSVESTIRFFADMYRNFDRQRATEILLKHDIALKVKVGKLSSGMSAKLKFIVTLCRDAELYMFDEPLNGIDLLARDFVIEELQQLRTKQKTLVISSHLVNEMEQVIDTAIFLRNGDIARQGNKDELAMQTGKDMTELYREVFNAS